MGFDVVSGGELFKVLKIGADPQKIIYSGVGKTKPELEYAVDNDIKSINIESLFELELLNQIGKEKNKVINTGIRSIQILMLSLIPILKLAKPTVSLDCL